MTLHNYLNQGIVSIFLNIIPAPSYLSFLKAGAGNPGSYNCLLAGKIFKAPAKRNMCMFKKGKRAIPV